MKNLRNLITKFRKLQTKLLNSVDNKEINFLCSKSFLILRGSIILTLILFDNFFSFHHNFDLTCQASGLKSNTYNFQLIEKSANLLKMLFLNFNREGSILSQGRYFHCDSTFSENFVMNHITMKSSFLQHAKTYSYSATETFEHRVPSRQNGYKKVEIKLKINVMKMAKLITKTLK